MASPSHGAHGERTAIAIALGRCGAVLTRDTLALLLLHLIARVSYHPSIMGRDDCTTGRDRLTGPEREAIAGCRCGQSFCRMIARLGRAAGLMVLLAQLTAAGAHAQGVGATPPASDSGAHSWVHESWTVKDGLPVNSINALLQDRTGYIWAATFDGLVRFDGLRFTFFNSANSEELPSNRIIQLKEGRDGSLWLITEQGHVVRFR